MVLGPEESLTVLCKDLLANIGRICDILDPKCAKSTEISAVYKKIKIQQKSVEDGMVIPFGKIIIKKRLEKAFASDYTIKFYKIITSDRSVDNYLRNVMQYIEPFFEKFNIELSTKIIADHFTELDQLQVIAISLDMYNSYSTYVQN